MADNQPLFGQAIPQDATLAKLALKRSLAQQLLAHLGDASPVSSKGEALNRIISPLLGVLGMNQANKEGGDLYNQAVPMYEQLAHSNDPSAFAAASQNPLIRALLPQLAGNQMEDTRALNLQKGKYALAAQYEPQIAGATADATGASNLKYGPQIAGATASAQVPAAIAQASGVASAQFPYQKALAVLQQGPEYANLAENKRFHDLQMTGGFGMGGGADFGGEPPTITDKGAYDKLPSGTVYKEADGKTYRKP